MTSKHILGLRLVDNPLEVATRHYSTIGSLFILVLLFGYLGGALILWRDINSVFLTWSVIGFVLLTLIGKFTVQTERYRLTRRTILVVLLTLTACFAASDLAYGKAQMPTMAELAHAEQAGFEPSAVALIANWEGRHMGDGVICPKNQHQSYQDIVGVWTKGYGHTATAGPDQCLTEWEARDILRVDIQAHWQPVWRQFTPTGVRNMSILRRVASASLAYNIGVRAFTRSTANRRFNRGDVRGGCKAMTRWNRAGGREVWGLVRRRTAEEMYCLWGLS